MSHGIVKPVELLQELLRFDTRNPPGHERECILHIRGLLATAGIESVMVSRDDARPNLIARLPGQGLAPPLLLYGHADVVGIDGQEWSVRPFAGEVRNGMIWGRGTADMKGGLAMMVWAMLDAVSSGATLPGDVLLAVFSDEERGSRNGAEFVVGERADLFTGVRFALGEVGGFRVEIGGRPVYLVQADEKVGCGVTATVRGEGGHAALEIRGQCIAKLGRMLDALDRNPLPPHITPVVQSMIDGLAKIIDIPSDGVRRALVGELSEKSGALVDDALKPLFQAMVRNSATPSIIRAGDADNVVPDIATVRLNGRMLPGEQPAGFVQEIRAVVGPEVDLMPDVGAVEVRPEPDLSFLPALRAALRTGDAAAECVPFLMPAGTDGRFLRRLGIQPYGFIPMSLPAGFDYFGVMHGADEHIPVDSVDFGAHVLRELITTPAVPRAG